jgi:hypothetical protein
VSGEGRQLGGRHDRDLAEADQFREPIHRLHRGRPLGELRVGRGRVTGHEAGRAERQVLLVHDREPQRRGHHRVQVQELAPGLIRIVLRHVVRYRDRGYRSG